MALLTEQKKRDLKLGPGAIVGKSRTCDACGKLIGSNHFVVNGKDAESVQCRDSLLLRQGPPANKKFKPKETQMKKDEAKKKKVDVDEEDAPDTNAADVDPDEDEEEAPAPKKAKKPPVEEDDDIEVIDDDDAPAPKKKKKVVEEDDEAEDEPAPKKKAKKAEDEEDEPVKEKPKAKAKPAAKKGGAKKPYAYRKGSTLLKLFTRLLDGKFHVRAEIFKGLSGPEPVLSRIASHATRFDGWEFVEKGDQVKLIVPKADQAIVLGKTKDEEE